MCIRDSSCFCTMYTSSTRKRVDHRAVLRAGGRSTRLRVELVCSRVSAFENPLRRFFHASPSPLDSSRLSRRESEVCESAFRSSMQASNNDSQHKSATSKRASEWIVRRHSAQHDDPLACASSLYTRSRIRYGVARRESKVTMQRFLVSKVSAPREDHRQSVFVARVDHFLVAS